MTQILDREVDEWRLLEDALPLFLSDLRDVWTLKVDATSDKDVAENSRTRFKSHIASLTMDLQTIRKIRPEGLLLEPTFRSCQIMLSNLLDFLEARIVKETILKSKDANAEPPQPTRGAKSLTDSIMTWLWTGIEEFMTGMRGAPPNPLPAETQPNAKDMGEEDCGVLRYPRLTRLAKLAQIGEKLADPLLLCRDHVRWELVLDDADKMLSLAWQVKKCFESASPSRHIREYQEYEPSICNFDYFQPWKDSAQLFHLLRRLTCKAGHVASLRLDGFDLNRMETTEPLKFSVFTTSCPLVEPDSWREGEYKPLTRVPNKFEYISNLCEHTRASPRHVYDVVFNTDSMWYQHDKPVGHASPTNEAYPAVSLSQLLGKGMFRDEINGDRFDDVDKAVLAFSLSLCLLHLFHGSWMQEVWTADDIYFLYRQAGASGQIFNIHYPYLRIRLSSYQPIGYPRPSRGECRPNLLSFAKLLVEIDSGKPFPIIQGNEKFEDVMWNTIRDLTERGKKSYAQAIEGCLQLIKGLPDTWRRSNESVFGEIRQKIFQDVVSPLEDNYRRFPGIMETPRDGPYEIRFRDDRDTCSAQRRRESMRSDFSADIAGSETEVALFDVAQSSGNSRASGAWIGRLISHQKSILGPCFNADELGRVRLTIIDTGLDDTHPFIVRRKWQRTRPSAGGGVPLFRDFVLDDESIEGKTNRPIDEDGHGTFIAGLVLQVARDVEISVARICITHETMKSDTSISDKVAKAIYHAMNTWEANIISISFSLTNPSSVVQDAVDAARNSNIIMVAAAGNWGRVQDVAFPATADGVFKIFAADPNGNRAGFSPPPTLDSSYCYSVLGSDLESIWPAKLKKEALERKLVFTTRSSEKRGLWTTMSGTSFATAVVAALVATVYQFYDTHKALVVLHKTSRGLKKIKAIKAILWRLSVAPADSKSQYNFLDPIRGRDGFFKFSPDGERDRTEFFATQLARAMLLEDA